METMRYGAVMERGEITEKTDEGYRVKSYDRDGVVTAAIPALDGKTFGTGQKVYFFMFPDGNGLVVEAF